MRSADAVTIFRVLLVFAIAYLIYLKFNAAALVLLILVAFLLDEVDGYLALGSKTNFIKYITIEAHGKHVYKEEDVAKLPKYGSALDIAGDRITEYTFWIAFAFLHVVPLFILFIVIIRNSLSDAFVSTSKKTFHNMRTGFGKIAYSHLARGAIGASKAVVFSYLTLVFVLGWPKVIGYVLVAYLITFFLLRGAAEIYEATR
ncbi:MAG: CDP-alcohol phosphatidyltransferase family protein [Candidatus Micrarchaeaceae archaeon]